MESEATTTSMPVDDDTDESNVARKRKRNRKSKVWQEMTEGKNAKVCKKRTNGLPLGEAVDDEEEFVFDMSELRKEILLCCAHTINLIVQSGLSCIENILDRVRNLVKFVIRSSSRSKDFSNIAQKHFHLEAKRKLRMDMQVHWNSTYMMLDNVLYYKDVFIHLGSLHATFKSNVPLEDEWDKLSVVHKFSKLFYDVTCMFSANKSSTSNMYFKKACMVHRRLLETSKDPHEFLAQMVLPMLEKFDKYWSEYNIYLACAAILDPRFKLKFVEYCFDKIYGLDEAMYKVEKVLNTLRSLYNEYKLTFSTSPIVAPSTTSSRIEDENFFDDYQSYNILEYWQQNVVRFPELAILTRDLLTILEGQPTMERPGRLKIALGAAKGLAYLHSYNI
uniref:hAT-like transposase RNase-H fold domain-containing protein n=1 Tax=Chenopodium quinoa TaxID=63459 RepID=A0A803MPJ3_CHEQI